MIKKSEHIQVGVVGEVIAVGYLREHGWRIREQNLVTEIGEIDIIAERDAFGRGQKKRIVAFVEVKSRRKSSAKRALEWSVTPKKRQKIIVMAKAYAKRHRLHDAILRFDVVTVNLHSQPPTIRHLEGAYDVNGRVR